MTDYSKYDYSKLFTPMQIGSMTVKNRLVMSPMGTFTPMQDGTESEEGIAYYERRAKGGLGMIIIGAMLKSKLSGVIPSGIRTGNQLPLNDVPVC